MIFAQFVWKKRLQIAVVGPSQKALDFVHKLSPGYQVRNPAQASASTSSNQPASAFPASPPLLPCPESVLALAKRLSAASILSPEERVLRAWNIGQQAKAQLASQPVPVYQPVSIDLPPNYFVVLRGGGFPEPRTLRSAADFRKAITGRGPPTEVGHEFPSETGARAYLSAAGYGYYAGV
eukprot:s978_g18.t1